MGGDRACPRVSRAKTMPVRMVAFLKSLAAGMAEAVLGSQQSQWKAGSCLGQWREPD